MANKMPSTSGLERAYTKKKEEKPMSRKTRSVLRWTARILAFLMLLFALPFYFGYGNPLPFVNPDYSLWENVALTMMPLVFIGLAVGWKYEKLGGVLVVGAIAVGFLTGLLTGAHISSNLLFPIIPGVLYLITGYQNPGKKK